MTREEGRLHNSGWSFKMSEYSAKSLREKMKAKARSLAGEKDQKVDSSDWTPAKPLDAGVKTGARRRVEPDWAELARELKRPGVNMMILWEEYRGAHPEGYGYSRFCDLFRGFERRLTPVMRPWGQWKNGLERDASSCWMRTRGSNMMHSFERRLDMQTWSGSSGWQSRVRSASGTHNY